MKHPRRPAFTLLELLIALALLGGLLTVAWSILGTLRDAEERAEGLASRLRVIRSARQWIEDDLQHVVAFVPAATNAIALPAFQGDSSGFSARLYPSLDPLELLQPFFITTTDEPAVGRLPDPERTVLVEYRALETEPTTANRTDTGSDGSRTGLSDGSNTSVASSAIATPQTGLRRMIHGRKASHDGMGVQDSHAEKVLSRDDLYRSSSVEDHAPPSTEISTIPGLSRIRFRYSDGQRWENSWDSSSRGSLPRAVELCFEVAKRSIQQRESSRSSSVRRNRSNRGLSPAQNRDSSQPEWGVKQLSAGNEPASYEHCLVFLVEAGPVTKSPHSPRTMEDTRMSYSWQSLLSGGRE